MRPRQGARALLTLAFTLLLTLLSHASVLSANNAMAAFECAGKRLTAGACACVWHCSPQGFKLTGFNEQNSPI